MLDGCSLVLRMALESFEERVWHYVPEEGCEPAGGALVAPQHGKRNNWGLLLRSGSISRSR